MDSEENRCRVKEFADELKEIVLSWKREYLNNDEFKSKLEMSATKAKELATLLNENCDRLQEELKVLDEKLAQHINEPRAAFKVGLQDELEEAEKKVRQQLTEFRANLEHVDKIMVEIEGLVQQGPEHEGWFCLD